MAIWPVQPLTNAADKTLDQTAGTVPNVSGAVAGWFQLCRFEQIVKTVVNFVLVETTIPLLFQGVIQPYTPQQLRILPEGQRLWKWYKVHAWPVLALVPDDIIVDQKGIRYRVMDKNDYSQYGFLEYSIVEDYNGSGPTGGA